MNWKKMVRRKVAEKQALEKQLSEPQPVKLVGEAGSIL